MIFTYLFQNMVLYVTNEIVLRVSPGSCQKNPSVPGVYIFTKLSSGESYVGSTIRLSTRVLSYFKPSKGLYSRTSKLLQEAKKNGTLSDWKVTIYPIMSELNRERKMHSFFF